MAEQRRGSRRPRGRASDAAATPRAPPRQRDLHVGGARHGGRGTSFDRGTFLLAKQLLYFERYGKMFLGDTSLLEDRAFFERVLGAGPLSAPPMTTNAAPAASRAAR
jgi:hypothetical protein